MAPELASPVKRVESLLLAAERLYAEGGNRPVPLAALARDVGLPEAHVYNYVGSEDALYLACHRRARVALQRTLDEISSQESEPAQQLQRSLLAIFEFIEAQRQGWDVLAERGADQLGPVAVELAASRRETVRLISQILTEAREAAGVDPGRVNTDTTASALVGAIGAVADWWRDHPEAQAGDVVGAMARVLWGGLPATLAD